LAVIVGGGVPGLRADNPGLQKFIFRAVFPVGLILVVVAGAELFTGNTACCIPAVLNKKTSWLGLARNWAASYVCNFIGSIFVVLFLTYLTGLLATDPWLGTITGIAEAMWLAIASDDVVSKVFGIWFPIMAFVAIGFEHSVANMFFIPAGIMYGANVT